MPEKVDIYVSEDGKDFKHIAQIWNDVSVKASDLLFKSFDTICNEKARYVRYHAFRSPMRGFIFLDEIVVNQSLTMPAFSLSLNELYTLGCSSGCTLIYVTC